MTSTTPEAEETPSPEAKGPSGRVRRIAVLLLIVLASVLLFGTAADIWVKRQVLSTPKWVAASDKILANPQVQAALSSYIVEEIYANVDVQKELGDKLPESWKGIAGPLSVGIRTAAGTAVEKILSTDRVQKIWHTVNETAHRTLVNVLEDKSKVASTSNGTVTLDVGEIVQIVGTDLGVPSSVMDKIPADVGQITIFQSDQLANIQRIVKVVNILGPILFTLIVGLYVLAVWLARGRRRLTLRNVGWAIIIVGLLLTTIRRLSGNYVGSIISDDQYSVAGKIIFGILSELLFDTAWLLITWGAVIVAGMLIIGPSRIATWARRTVAPVLNADRTTFWIGAAVAYLLVLWFVPSPALRLWWSVLILGAVGALGLEYLRRRSLAEFPESRLDIDVDGMKESATKTWTNLTSRFSGSRDDDHVAKLQKLTELHSAGSLSDEEFAAAKKKLLD